MPRSIVTGTPKTTKPIFAATPGGGTRLKTGARKNSGSSNPTTTSVTPSAAESGSSNGCDHFREVLVGAGRDRGRVGDQAERRFDHQVLDRVVGDLAQIGVDVGVGVEGGPRREGMLARFDRRAAVFVLQREAEVFEAEVGARRGGEAGREGQCREKQ